MKFNAFELRYLSLKTMFIAVMAYFILITYNPIISIMYLIAASIALIPKRSAIIAPIVIAIASSLLSSFNISTVLIIASCMGLSSRLNWFISFATLYAGYALIVQSINTVHVNDFDINLLTYFVMLTLSLIICYGFSGWLSEEDIVKVVTLALATIIVARIIAWLTPLSSSVTIYGIILSISLYVLSQKSLRKSQIAK